MADLYSFATALAFLVDASRALRKAQRDLDKMTGADTLPPELEKADHEVGMADIAVSAARYLLETVYGSEVAFGRDAVPVIDEVKALRTRMKASPERQALLQQLAELDRKLIDTEGK